MSLIRARMIAIAVLLMISGSPAMSAPPERAGTLTEEEMAKVKGEVGIAVIDKTRNKQFFVNQSVVFPMQSVCKLPISVAILKLVDAGDLSLNDKLVVHRKDLIPYNSSIADELKGDQGSFTVRDLIGRMLRDSDNTACDVLIERVGGAGAITKILTEAGIKGIRVDRSIKNLATDSEAIENFLEDPRDTAAPEAVTDFLQKLYTGRLLSKDSTALIIKDLFSCNTGTRRLKAGLAAGWKLAHKTGTGPDINGQNVATNDVGVMAGPKGQVIYIAVFTKGSRAKIEEREALIARVAAAAIAGDLQ